jgi:hypothetical protein
MLSSVRGVPYTVLVVCGDCVAKDDDFMTSFEQSAAMAADRVHEMQQVNQHKDVSWFTGFWIDLLA